MLDKVGGLRRWAAALKQTKGPERVGCTHYRLIASGKQNNTGRFSVGNLKAVGRSRP